MAPLCTIVFERRLVERNAGNSKIRTATPEERANFDVRLAAHSGLVGANLADRKSRTVARREMGWAQALTDGFTTNLWALSTTTGEMASDY